MAPRGPSRSSGSEVTRLDAHFAESRSSQPAETNSAIRIAALEAELKLYRAHEHERTFENRPEIFKHSIAAHSSQKPHRSSMFTLFGFFAMVGLGGLAVGGLAAASQIPGLRSQFAKVFSPTQETSSDSELSQETALSTDSSPYSPAHIITIDTLDAIHQEPESPTVTQSQSPAEPKVEIHQHRQSAPAQPTPARPAAIPQSAAPPAQASPPPATTSAPPPAPQPPARETAPPTSPPPGPAEAPQPAPERPSDLEQVRDVINEAQQVREVFEQLSNSRVEDIFSGGRNSRRRNDDDD